jgi:hypothetical protein
MSQARRCNVCGNYGEPPYDDWVILRPTDRPRPGEQIADERERVDICSRECHDLYRDSLQLQPMTL